MRDWYTMEKPLHSDGIVHKAAMNILVHVFRQAEAQSGIAGSEDMCM